VNKSCHGIDVFLLAVKNENIDGEKKGLDGDGNDSRCSSNA
jgi:hypothetical protein